MIQRCLIAVLLLLAPLAHAADVPPPPGMQKGQIKALIVQGNVTVTKADGTTSKLARNAIIAERETIQADKDASAFIVFSNGDSMIIKSNANVKVAQYSQAPFDEKANGTFLALEKDPSKSIVRLDVDNGTVAVDVKDLNYSNGSTFELNTPAGICSFRKTPSIFYLLINRDSKTGNFTDILASCAEGDVSLVGGPSITMPSGSQIQIAVAVDPSSGSVTGITINGAVLNQEVSQIFVEGVYASINQARAASGLTPLSVPAVPLPTKPLGVPIVPPMPNPTSPIYRGDPGPPPGPTHQP